MICQFKRLIYPKAVTAGDASYMIALYRPCEKVMDAAGNVVSEIKAVGYCLPTADNLRYDMRGRWSRSAKHGIQFEVEGFDEVIVPSKEGVISYLCSGQIKGIGPKTAEKIYAMFGQNTLTVLDHEPEQLLAVSGISKTKLKKICDSYLASRGARDVVAFLAPHGVTPNRAVKLYKQYGEQTMDIVRNHPYRLCEMVGVGFKTADRIAISMGFDPLSPERVDEGLIFTLTDAELKRHLCMEKHSFLKQCLLYRIEVLYASQAFCQTAPVTTDVAVLSGHYQLVDAYIQCLTKERRLGQPADQNLKAKRQTASETLDKVVLDCRKRFSSFTPTDQNQYRKGVSSLINTVLPVWLKLRNTYINISK